MAERKDSEQLSEANEPSFSSPPAEKRTIFEYSLYDDGTKGPLWISLQNHRQGPISINVKYIEIRAE